MTEGPDPYREFAEKVVVSDDPYGEILALARFVSADEARRRRRWWIGGSVAAVLVVGSIVALAVTGDEVARDDTQVEIADDDLPPLRDLEWLDEIKLRPHDAGVSKEELADVRAFLQHPEPRARRDALRVLARRHSLVSDEELLWFLANPDGQADSQALKMVWWNCSRTGTFVSPRAIEPFLESASLSVRKSAIRALTSIKGYAPSPEAIQALEAADPAVRRVAKKLLQRTGH